MDIELYLTIYFSASYTKSLIIYMPVKSKHVDFIGVEGKKISIGDSLDKKSLIAIL
jgi:hypothetical protein